MRKFIDWILCRNPIDENQQADEDEQAPPSNLQQSTSSAEPHDAGRLMILQQERQRQAEIKEVLAKDLLLMNFDVPDDRSMKFQKASIIANTTSALKDIMGRQNPQLYKEDKRDESRKKDKGGEIFYHPNDLSQISEPEPYELASALLGQLREGNLTQFQSCRYTEKDGSLKQQEFKFFMEIPYQDSPSAEPETKKFIFVIGTEITGKIKGYGLTFADQTITEKPNFRSVVAGYSKLFAEKKGRLVMRGEEVIVASPSEAQEDHASGVFPHGFNAVGVIPRGVSMLGEKSHAVAKL